ncbi:MAG: DUF3619 family protein [Rhizobacter sp.]|nr:DUF3619 family protein [Rhizobacter sp.]
MNNYTNLRRPYAPAALEALEARLALRMTAHLTEATADLAPDVTERLRFAREQALQRARAARTATAAEPVVVVGAGSSASLGRGEGGSGWWVQLAALIPLVALVGGLMLIQQMHTDNQIAAAAEIDASLLADDLPPSAYSDPGFVEFLKAPRD